MARYIDADKFAERIELSPAFKNMAFEGDLLQRVVLDLLNNTPTADVVEVVRCRDCKYYETINLKGTTISSCNNSLLGLTHVKPDAYCSFGERREE